MEIYQPSDDSLFFADFLKKYFKTHNHNIRCLDMGTGSGILAKTISQFVSPENVTALDINPDAVKALKKEKFKVIQSDLFGVFDKRKSQSFPNPYKSQIPNPKSHTIKFDLIVFNAPYLPLDKREPASSRVATTGGPRGDEISLKFLRAAKSHLNKKSKIFLLVSSLTPLDKMEKLWPFKIVARKKIFMEELLILEFEK